MVGEGRGEGKALGIFSSQRISRSKRKNHSRGLKHIQTRSYDKGGWQGSASTTHQIVAAL